MPLSIGVQGGGQQLAPPPPGGGGGLLGIEKLTLAESKNSAARSIFENIFIF